MAQLNYQVLRESGYNGYVLENAPEKVMQFGEGNFLRAFVDYFIDIANEKADYNGKVVLVQPIAQGLTELINQQEGLYTLYLRGSENGEKVDEKRVISCVSRCVNPYGEWDKVLELAKSDDLEIIVSNTTEAGIVHDTESTFDQNPPTSFPAKLTRVLYERWKAGKKGLVILSCELIDNNGKELQKCVNQYIDDWKLEDEFRAWVNDRIRRSADGRRRGVRDLGDRRTRRTGRPASLQEGGRAGDCGAGRDALQEAEGSHSERCAHGIRAGGLSGGIRHRSGLHA